MGESMRMRALGTSGIQASVVGLGTFAIGGGADCQDLPYRERAARSEAFRRSVCRGTKSTGATYSPGLQAVASTPRRSRFRPRCFWAKAINYAIGEWPKLLRYRKTVQLAPARPPASAGNRGAVALTLTLIEPYGRR